MYVLFRRGFANRHVYTKAAFSSIRAVEGAQSVIHIGGDRSHHVPSYRAYPNDLGLDESGLKRMMQVCTCSDPNNSD